MTTELEIFKKALKKIIGVPKETKRKTPKPRPKKKDKLAQLIMEEFRRMGYTAEDCDLRPAQGSWRTDVRLDVRRFEGNCIINGLLGYIYSWERMTDLIKSGIKITEDGHEWEISRKK